MILTDNTNKIFWAWYYKQYKRYKTHKFLADSDNERGFNIRMKLNFLCKSISEQWGIYEDFADHLGFEICVDRATDEELNSIDAFSWVVMQNDTNDNFNGGVNTDTRDESRIECIEKFNQEINKLTRVKL